MGVADIFKNPRPWLPRDAVAYLSEIVRPTDRVLEFGGGSSSLWWCKHAGFVYTCEANGEWACQLIQEALKQPYLLRKWTMMYAPCDWNPTIGFPKDYWKEHREKISTSQVSQLEQVYTHIPFSPDIIVIDGAIRPSCLYAADEYARSNPVRIVVIDNLETMGKYVGERFRGFQRHIFQETEASRIPRHQKGDWRTGVFVRPEV